MLILLLATISIYCQDRYPGRQLFQIKDGITSVIRSQDSAFKQHHLICGWHWDGSPYLSDSMHYNQSEIATMAFNDPNIKYYNDFHNMSFTIQLNDNEGKKAKPYDFDAGYSHYTDAELFHFKSMQFEAGLRPLTNKSYKSYEDWENPVFGFKNRWEFAIIDSSESIAGIVNRTVLLPKIDDYSTETVRNALSQSYPDMFFKESIFGRAIKNYKDSNKTEYYNYTRNFRGNAFHVSIRVKGKFGDSLSYYPYKTDTNTVVLRIRLPFIKQNDSTGFLKFTRLPYKHHDSIDIVRSSYDETILGRRRKLNPTNEINNYTFEITKSMLYNLHTYDPDYQQNGISNVYKDQPGWITIHALVVFDKDIDVENNPNVNKEFGTVGEIENILYLTTNSGSLNDYKRISVEVDYVRNTNIWIDWVRIGTPHTEKVLWGEYDTNIHKLVDYSFTGQNSAMKDLAKKNRNFRFTSVVEGDIQNWGGIKYLGKVVGDVFVGEAEPIFGQQYYHYTNMATNWVGLYLHGEGIAVPFVKYGGRDYGGDNIAYNRNGDTLHIGWRFPNYYAGGYGKGAFGHILNHNKYLENSNHRYNYEELKEAVFNSDYETHCKNLNNYTLCYNEYKEDYYKFLNDNDSDKYIFPSVQQYFERHLNKHYDEEYKLKLDDDDYLKGFNGGILYADNDWWGQTFNIAVYNDQSDGRIENNPLYRNRMSLAERQLTAEELRLIQNNYMIMGAKGVMQDGQVYGSDKTYCKQTLFDAYVDPMTDTIQRNEVDKPWWDFYKPGKKYWVERETLESDGLLLNKELGDDFLGDWHKNVMRDALSYTRDGYKDYLFFRNQILGDRLVDGVRYPINKHFGLALDTSKSFQTISKLSGVNYIDDQHTRLYVGMRSSRLETAKMNRYFSTPEVDSILMKCKLAGWFGKGFRRISNYDKKVFKNNPLSYILDVNNIRTYKLKGYDFTTRYPIVDEISEQATNIDSGFYDITILRINDGNIAPDPNDDKKMLRNGFILCVQNRRTDPLTIDSWLRNSLSDNSPNEYRTVRHFELTNDTLDVFSRERINFLSQAEYEERLMTKPNPYTGTAKENYEHFGNMYWGKFGARKIELNLLKKSSLPILTYGCNNMVPCISISELGEKDRTLKTLYWRKQLFKPQNIISFGLDKTTISTYLQPGEAKYFYIKGYNPFVETTAPIKIDFQKLDLTPERPIYKNTIGIVGKIDITEAITDFPITLQVMKKNIALEIVENANEFNMSTEVVISNDTINNTYDTSKVYTFLANSLQKTDSLHIFNIYHNETVAFPVKLSYEYNLVDTGIISKDTIIYIGGSTHPKINLEESGLKMLSLRDLQSIPNPSNNKFDLQFTSDVRQELTISIIDNTGAVMLNNIKYLATVGTNKINIKTNDLPIGNYILVINNNSTKYHHKINVVR